MLCYYYSLWHIRIALHKWSPLSKQYKIPDLSSHLLKHELAEYKSLCVSYYNKDRKWNQECRWRMQCICHESRCCGGPHTAAGCRSWSRVSACSMWMIIIACSAISLDGSRGEAPSKMIFSHRCSGLVLAMLTTVWDDPSSNLTVGSCVYHDSHYDIQPWAQAAHPYCSV